MIWAQIKLLLPSVFVHWVLLVAVATGAWYAWTRVYKHHFKWQGPVIVATLVAVYSFTNTVFGLYQNGVLVAFQQNVQAQLQQAARQQQAQQQGPTDPVLQMKSQFLRNVEALVQNPQAITDENKKKLFNDFGKLFPSKKDKELAKKAVAQVYDCQKYFWEDAMSSFKAKQAVKSDARKDCEKMSGNFFNREKLLPAEVVKNNDETIAGFAARKRVPASDGKSTVEVSENMLRDALESQARATENVRKIFE
jgi:hypothetical protein